MRVRMRIRRNPKRDYTEAQKLDRSHANNMVIRARILELGVSKILEDDCGLEASSTRTAAQMLAEAASIRYDSEQIYTRIRREAADAAAAAEAEETNTDI